MLDKYINYLGKCFQHVPDGVSVGMLVVFVVGAILFCSFLGWKKGAKWSAGLLLVEYMVLLIILSLLARKVYAERLFDFTPFWSYRAIRAGKHALLIQDVANVAAFIPIGLLLGCVFRRIKWWHALLAGAAFSLLIEALQFFLKRGFAEFDDLFHNVLGCAIGFGVYAGVKWMVKTVRERR